mgnify:FL=1
MSRKSTINRIVLAIGTWLFIYVALRLLGVRHAKTVTFIIMLVNLIIFPFALEYPYNIGTDLTTIIGYTVLFFAFGPLSLLANIKFIYLMCTGG